MFKWDFAGEHEDQVQLITLHMREQGIEAIWCLSNEACLCKVGYLMDIFEKHLLNLSLPDCLSVNHFVNFIYEGLGVIRLSPL